jgi:hypothetical protein
VVCADPRTVDCYSRRYRPDSLKFLIQDDIHRRFTRSRFGNGVLAAIDFVRNSVATGPQADCAADTAD